MNRRQRNILIGVGAVVSIVCVVLGYRAYDTARSTMSAVSSMSGADDDLLKLPKDRAADDAVGSPAPLPAPRRRRANKAGDVQAPADGPVRLERSRLPRLREGLGRPLEGSPIGERLKSERLIRAQRVPLGGRGQLTRPRGGLGEGPGFDHRGETIGGDDLPLAVGAPSAEGGQVDAQEDDDLPQLQPGDLDTGPE